MSLSVAILAGGLGTRLKSKTNTKPKALIDIAGKPFIIRQLDHLFSEGIKHIVICAGHFGQQIEDLIGSGNKFNLKIDYSYDGQELLGTGGAIKKALPFLGKDFFILYGDSFLPIKYNLIENAFYKAKKTALMTIFKNIGKWDTSNVSLQKNIVVYDKKKPKPNMIFIDCGLSVVNNSIFDLYPKDKNFDLGDIYHQLSLKGKLAVHEVYDRFYEIGSSSGLNETIGYFKKNN